MLLEDFADPDRPDHRQLARRAERPPRARRADGGAAAVLLHRRVRGPAGGRADDADDCAAASASTSRRRRRRASRRSTPAPRPGRWRSGAPGKGTLFSQALTECLDGLADEPRSRGPLGRHRHVAGRAAARARDGARRPARRRAGRRQPAARSATSCCTSSTPGRRWRSRSAVEPAEAAPFCFARLDDSDGATIVERSPMRRRWSTTVPAGLYTVAVVHRPARLRPPYVARQTAALPATAEPAPVVVTVS